MEKLTPPSPKSNIQLALAVLVTLAGILLIFFAFFVPPEGIISSSVLIAFGEIATFAGSLMGIDYHYRYRQ